MIEFLSTKNNLIRTKDEIFITKSKSSKNKNSLLYDAVGGTTLFERCRIPGTLSFFDFEIVKTKVLANMSTRHKVILDLGCGDGRFTYEFLKNPNTRVICVDSSYESLLRLKKNIDMSANRDRVLLINEDILKLPKFDKKVDAVWAFESLYYLDNDYGKGVNNISKLIKSNGVLYNAERNYSGGVFHSLINGRLDHFFEAANDNKIYDYFEDSELRTPSFKDKEIINILQNCGLKLKKTHRLPIVNAYLSFLLSQKIYNYEEIKINSKKLLDTLVNMDLSEDSSRVTIYKSKKA